MYQLLGCAWDSFQTFFICHSDRNHRPRSLFSKSRKTDVFAYFSPSKSQFLQVSAVYAFSRLSVTFCPSLVDNSQDLTFIHIAAMDGLCDQGQAVHHSCLQNIILTPCTPHRDAEDQVCKISSKRPFSTLCYMYPEPWPRDFLTPNRS